MHGKQTRKLVYSNKTNGEIRIKWNVDEIHDL